MKKISLLLLLFVGLFIVSQTTLYAQYPSSPNYGSSSTGSMTVDPAIIRAEIAKRGFTVEEVQTKLQEKGLNLDINNIRVDELRQSRKVIEEAIAELEKERAAKELGTDEADASVDDATDEDGQKVTKAKTTPKTKKKEQEIIDEEEEGETSMTDEEMMDNEVLDEEEGQTELAYNKNRNNTRPERDANGRLIVRKSAKDLRKAKRDKEKAARANTDEQIQLADVFGVDTTITDEMKMSEVVYGQHLFLKEIKKDKTKAKKSNEENSEELSTTKKTKKPTATTDDRNYIKEVQSRAGEDYVLGTGDVLNISIGGRSFYNSNFTIDKNGGIQPDRLPRINLKGMTVGAARKLLISYYTRFYVFNSEEFYVSVQGMRIVPVNVVGEVNNPGTYSLSGGNSAFNALFVAGGIAPIGSVRNIQVVRASGEKRRFDLYEYLASPSGKNFALFENDYVSVPAAERTVKLLGSVKRPYRYELIKGENLTKLIEFAGGFGENAYLSDIQVKRFVNDKERIISVNYRDLKAQGRDFELLNGDVVVVKKIGIAYDNFVNIGGAVVSPDNYEIAEGMTVADVIRKAGGLDKQARLDVAYIQRIKADLSKQLIRITNLDEIVANPSSAKNIKVKSQDRIYIFNQARFANQDSIYVYGATRSFLKFPYDPDKNIRVSDAVNLSGGLRPDATDFAYIVRTDPNNSKQVEYIRIDNLRDLMKDTANVQNIQLAARDQLRVFSRLTYTDTANIAIGGAVRIPARFRYDETLNIKDVLLLAGGLKMEAASNRVDVFRVEIIENEEVKTIVKTLTIDRNTLDAVGEDAGFQLMAHDEVEVRTVPDWSLQKFVQLLGEFRYPGRYALIDRNEKLREVLKRAGGLSVEAFPAGATLYRQQDGTGYVILKLEEVLKDSNSVHNFILKDGDIIDIPKTKDFVTILGATKANELYPERVLLDGKINVAYYPGKDAYYYVDNFAAGVGKEGRRRLISVQYPNGAIKRTRDYVLFKSYPKIEKGSVITVGYVEKKKEKEKNKTESKPIDWGKVLGDSVAQATAILSLILLIQRF